jgi:hypothetical protein
MYPTSDFLFLLLPFGAITISIYESRCVTTGGRPSATARVRLESVRDGFGWLREFYHLGKSWFDQQQECPVSIVP